jgi:hypothetical protein
VVDELPVAEIDEQRHSRVRDHPKVDEVRTIAETSHADPRHQARP